MTEAMLRKVQLIDTLWKVGKQSFGDIFNYILNLR